MGPYGCSSTCSVTKSSPKLILGATEGFRKKSNVESLAGVTKQPFSPPSVACPKCTWRPRFRSQDLSPSATRCTNLAHVTAFQNWVLGMGLILEEVTLPYIQLAPVTIKKPSFLQGTLRAYSQVWSGGGSPSPTAWASGTQYFSEGRWV